ncbi:MAG: hypothetical protein JKX85_10665, partial [Phycisphaeraceae bacterium]|nr:hypothetical protein [Phycisphaeraceae bacterium]
AADEHRGISLLMADVAEVSQRTVQNWLAGEHVIQLPHITRLLRSQRTPQNIKDALMALITEGSGYSASSMTDADLDADGDGKVTCGDALLHVATACESSGTCVRNLVAALSDGQVDPDEYTNARWQLTHNITAIHRALAALDQGVDAQVKRRSAINHNFSDTYKSSSSPTNRQHPNPNNSRSGVDGQAQG